MVAARSSQVSPSHGSGLRASCRGRKVDRVGPQANRWWWPTKTFSRRVTFRVTTDSCAIFR